ncbi:MAG: hypothetical protein ABH839_04070 [Chloroflexota bacterium]
MGRRDVSVEVVENVQRTSFKDLVANDIEVTKKDILDTLGCVVSGSSHPPFGQLVTYLKGRSR